MTCNVGNQTIEKKNLKLFIYKSDTFNYARCNIPCAVDYYTQNPISTKKHWKRQKENNDSDVMNKTKPEVAQSNGNIHT